MIRPRASIPHEVLLVLCREGIWNFGQQQISFVFALHFFDFRGATWLGSRRKIRGKISGMKKGGRRSQIPTSCVSRVRQVLNGPLFPARAWVAGGSWLVQMMLAVTGYVSPKHSVWEQYVHLGLGVSSLLLVAVAGSTLLSVAGSTPQAAGQGGEDPLRMGWSLLWAFMWMVTDFPMALIAYLTLSFDDPADLIPGSPATHSDPLHTTLAVASMACAGIGAVHSALTLISLFGEPAKSHLD